MELSTSENKTSLVFLKNLNKGVFRIFSLLFLVSVLIFSACSPKTTPKPAPIPAPNTPTPSTPEKEPNVEPKKEVEKPKDVVKEKPQIIISLILPFELDDINYKTATHKNMRTANIAIDFYQGFKMGLDSVAHKRNAIDFKLQVYDSKDNPTALSTLAAKSSIKASDLIVGPIFPSGVSTFSKYDKLMKKPMVSPLAATDPSTFNNPYLITINNSLDQHAYKAAAFIKSQLNPKKIILIRSGQADEYKYAVPFKKGMDSLAKGLPLSEIGIKAVGYENVYKQLSPIGLNVIVLPATDRVFLLTLFHELDKLTSNFQIAIIGHPGWEKASFLDQKLMERLSAYITSSSQIDFKSYRNSNFRKYYRANYSIEPSDYSVKGFDIGYYFANLMNEKGKDFMSEIQNKQYDGLHNFFNFRKDAKTGYYNTSLMMMKYQFGQLRKVD